MTTALSTVKSSLPAYPSRHLDTVVAKYTNALEAIPGQQRRAISESFAPSADDRAAMEERHSRLCELLVPADEKVIRRSVGTLRAAFPAANTGADDAMIQIKLYVAALERYPEWAINEACRRYLDGTAGSLTFAPTPPEAATLCRRIIAPLQEERAQLEAVLTAEAYADPSPEARERAAKAWEVMRASFVEPEAAKGPKETPEQALARLAADTTPLAVGEGLRKKLDEMKGEAA